MAKQDFSTMFRLTKRSIIEEMLNWETKAKLAEHLMRQKVGSGVYLGDYNEVKAIHSELLDCLISLVNNLDEEDELSTSEKIALGAKIGTYWHVMSDLDTKLMAASAKGTNEGEKKRLASIRADMAVLSQYKSAKLPEKTFEVLGKDEEEAFAVIGTSKVKNK